MVDNLSADEKIYYRDRLRSARYSALADSEGFGEICFAIEALGLRLTGEKGAIGTYRAAIGELAKNSVLMNSLFESFPQLFTKFSALYETLRRARNDVMHTGVYARHATSAAIELCIGLEEVLMANNQANKLLVGDYMVKSPVIIQSWQPIAYARQLMLTHSFSYLPVYLDEWKIVSEYSMAKFLHGASNQSKVLAVSIKEAAVQGLKLSKAKMVEAEDDVSSLLNNSSDEGQSLWLVSDKNKGISGVLSPFELM